MRGRTRAETRARMDRRRETLRAQQLQALSEAAAVGKAEEDGDEQLDGYVEEELALLFRFPAFAHRNARAAFAMFVPPMVLLARMIVHA